nr:cysteine desulfurase family protein [uncultured Arsenicibacter sp.]
MTSYLDNAATTALDEEVLQVMLPFFRQYWGNASAVHRQGIFVRKAIEEAREQIASILRAHPDDILFTSGATEANNMALMGSIRSGNIREVITSPIEHQSVLQPLVMMEKQGIIRLHMVRIDDHGRIDYGHLAYLLESRRSSGLSHRNTGGILISLMHGNNEIGNLTDIQKVAGISQEYDCIFHSDTVQTLGHYSYDLLQTPVDFITGSAHKFHGPQGVGLLYIRNPLQLPALWHGGAQERGMRPGTENIAGIVGMAKALELAHLDLLKHQTHIRHLKARLLHKLMLLGIDIQFNGTSDLLDESIDTILSISLPVLPSGNPVTELLNRAGLSVSGGSARSNLEKNGSHVLKAIGVYPDRENIRISLSRLNTNKDIDFFVKTIQEFYHGDARALATPKETNNRIRYHI